jgi:hypothetical protein
MNEYLLLLNSISSPVYGLTFREKLYDTIKKDYPLTTDNHPLSKYNDLKNIYNHYKRITTRRFREENSDLFNVLEGSMKEQSKNESLEADYEGFGVPTM